MVPPKGASARKLENSNLFSEDQTYEKERKIYKTNPARYNHFDIGDHDENDPMQYRAGEPEKPKPLPMVSRSNRAQAQWGFEDSATPAKPSQKIRESDAVHFSIDDNQNDNEQNRQKGAGGAKPRRDAETHFDFRDEPTPAPRRIIGRTKAAQGLYVNNILNDEDEDDVYGSRKAPLSNISNNASRRNNDVHWSNTGDSLPAGTSDGMKKATGVNQSRSAKNMESHWDNYEEAPSDIKKPSHDHQRQGMEAHWSVGGQGTEAAPARKTNGRQPEKSFWDF